MAHTPGTAIIPGGESSDVSRRVRPERHDRPERQDRLDRPERYDRHDRLARDRGRGSTRAALDEISKRIIELHGGTVGVESTLGRGSVFWITLPIIVEQQVGGL